MIDIVSCHNLSTYAIYTNATKKQAIWKKHCLWSARRGSSVSVVSLVGISVWFVISLEGRNMAGGQPGEDRLGSWSAQRGPRRLARQFQHLLWLSNNQLKSHFCQCWLKGACRTLFRSAASTQMASFYLFIFGIICGVRGHEKSGCQYLDSILRPRS